jgi:predicted TIM-barrel fold metal-dependent hydrolase
MEDSVMNLAALALVMLVTGVLTDPAPTPPPVDSRRLPIIDMHLHAFQMEDGQGPPTNPVTKKSSAARTTAELREASLAALKRYNIVKAVTSGPLETVTAWREVAPDRVIPAVYVGTDDPFPEISKLRADIQAGRVKVLGELGLQYMGLSPTDPQLEPYFALAEELDIPVGIHTGLAARGTPYDPCCPKFRVTLGNPILLEEVLIRHPKLRVYLMHAGGPFLQETKAIMALYPQVYADLGVIDWIIPRDEFHHALQTLVRAGFGKRLMFGSDQMVWPEAIGMAIEGIESAAFLTDEQKRDIFYNNAARFLRIEKAE